MRGWVEGGRRRRQRGYSNKCSAGGGARYRYSSSRLHWRVQQETEPVGGEAPCPQGEHRRTCWQVEEVHTKGGAAYGWERAYSLPPSLSHHA